MIRQIVGVLVAWLAVWCAWATGLIGMSEAEMGLAYTFAGIAVLCLSRSPLVLIALSTTGGVAIYIWQRPADETFHAALILVPLAFIGMFGLLALLYRVTSWPSDAVTKIRLLAAIIFVGILGIVAGHALGVAAARCSNRYDLVLYRLDRLLFGDLVGRIGQATIHYRPLFLAEEQIYFALPCVMIILFTLYLNSAHQSESKLLDLYLLTAICGFAIYVIVPTSGPIFAFANAFPNSLPSASTARLDPRVFQAPPNAVPSLHFANALLVFWNSKPWPRMRLFASLFVVMTAIATMGIGEHYATDLLIAIPFALAMQSICFRIPGRWTTLAIAAALVTFWTLTILFFQISHTQVAVVVLFALLSVSCPALAPIARQIERRRGLRTTFDQRASLNRQLPRA